MTNDPATPVARIGADELTPSDPTPGMSRSLAMHDAGMWTGVVDTEPGSVSGWHHHGEHDSTIYVVSGTLRMEFGPGGRDTFDAVAGDVVQVPAGAVHREANPLHEESLLVVVRCGTGSPTVNVDGPAAG